MTPAPISVERLRELLDSLDTVSDGDYLSRLANGQRINDACINWLRENGAALLQQLAELKESRDAYRHDAEALLQINKGAVAALEAAERAREEAAALVARVVNNTYWRTNDNKLWPDLIAFLAASGGA